jgi:hypothetical protein
VRRVGIVSETRAFVTWACEGCQELVDQAVKVHVLMLGLKSGAISMGALFAAGNR